jgi:hypothetical protein
MSNGMFVVAHCSFRSTPTHPQPNIGTHKILSADEQLALHALVVVYIVDFQIILSINNSASNSMQNVVCPSASAMLFFSGGCNAVRIFYFEKSMWFPQTIRRCSQHIWLVKQQADLCNTSSRILIVTSTEKKICTLLVQLSYPAYLALFQWA